MSVLLCVDCCVVHWSFDCVLSLFFRAVHAYVGFFLFSVSFVHCHAWFLFLFCVLVSAFIDCILSCFLCLRCCFLVCVSCLWLCCLGVACYGFRVFLWSFVFVFVSCSLFLYCLVDSFGCGVIDGL